MHFDSSIVRTLVSYSVTALTPERLSAFTAFPEWAGSAGAAVFGVALGGFAIWCALRHDWLPLVLVAWFMFLLASRVVLGAISLGIGVYLMK